nr:MAG TPA: hypothetical protein [Caudoviricetes sp.]
MIPFFFKKSIILSVVPSTRIFSHLTFLLFVRQVYAMQ